MKQNHREDPSLGLHEELLLIALRDEQGTPESRASMLDLSLAGAILAELALREQVSLDPDKKRRVHPGEAGSTGDQVLDACLAKVAERCLERNTPWLPVPIMS